MKLFPSSLGVIKSENAKGMVVDLQCGGSAISVLLDASSASSSAASTPQRPQRAAQFLTRRLDKASIVGYLSFEVSQKEFYIQLTEDTELLEQVAEKVQTQSAKGKPIKECLAGQACLAKFSEDMCWYRAEVKELKSNGIEVFFIDYGNSSVVNRADMVEVNQELLDIPPLSIRCGLSNVDTSLNLTEWAEGRIVPNFVQNNDLGFVRL